MIAQVIDLLQKNDFIGAGNFTEIAKGKNELVLDWKKLKIKGLEQKQKLDWNGLKTIVIGNKEQFAKAMKQFGYTGKYFNLRKKLFDFVKSKQAHEMYFATLADKSKNSGSDSDE